MTAVNLATAVEFQAEIARLQAEVERLRLTDAERVAVERLIGIVGPCADAATLRGMLERLSPPAT